MEPESRRTTKDLIDEFEGEAENFTIAAIAVAFKHETKFVFYKRGKQPSMLEQLNEEVNKGGEPVGIVGIRRGAAADTLSIGWRTFAELEGETWVENYFDGLMDAFLMGAKAIGAEILSVPKHRRH